MFSVVMLLEIKFGTFFLLLLSTNMHSHLEEEKSFFLFFMCLVSRTRAYCAAASHVFPIAMCCRFFLAFAFGRHSSSSKFLLYYFMNLNEPIVGCRRTFLILHDLSNSEKKSQAEKNISAKKCDISILQFGGAREKRCRPTDVSADFHTPPPPPTPLLPEMRLFVCLFALSTQLNGLTHRRSTIYYRFNSTLSL